jgi:hypothetical protein
MGSCPLSEIKQTSAEVQHGAGAKPMAQSAPRLIMKSAQVFDGAITKDEIDEDRCDGELCCACSRSGVAKESV